MKYLIATDIHGSSISAKIIKEKFEKLGANKLVLLGDILYHGARNDLPEGYAPKEVTEILNSLADKIIAVRGNCDSEVDQMVLNFMINENAAIDIGGKFVFLTHGHHVNPEVPAKLANGSIVLYGHFHVTKKTVVDGVTYINVASITLPKNGCEKCYGILDEKGVQIFNLNDQLILEEKF